MLDLFDWKILDHVLQHGPCTERAMRDYRIDPLRPEFNWGTTSPRLSRLAKLGFLQKTKLGLQKYVYDIGEPEWKKIVEEQARASPGKMVPSLPLGEVRALIASKLWSRIKVEKVEFDLVAYDRDEKGVRKVIRIDKGLVVKPGPPPQSPTGAGYKDLTGLHERMRASEPDEVRGQMPETIARASVPLPPPRDPPPVDLSRQLTAESSASNNSPLIVSRTRSRHLTFVLPRSQLGPVLTALAKEQSEALQLPDWF